MEKYLIYLYNINKLLINFLKINQKDDEKIKKLLDDYENKRRNFEEGNMGNFYNVDELFQPKERNSLEELLSFSSLKNEEENETIEELCILFINENMRLLSILLQS